MIEQEITFRSNGVTLAGTITLPGNEGPYPGALFIPGSGMVDRDENHKKMAINSFNELAGHLARQGFASLRYDKRGVAASQGSFLSAGFYDNAADAGAGFACLREHEKVDSGRVFIIGHSEGALIASRLAGEGTPAAGIALLAGTAQPGGHVLRWQAGEIAKHIQGFQKKLITLLRIDPRKSQEKILTKIAASDKEVMRVQLVVKINAKWMREFMAYNPADDLAKTSCPVLAVTGGHDIQVDPADINRMQEIVPSPFEGHVVPEVSHMLRKGELGMADYKRQIKLPLDREVVSLLLDWLKRQTGT